MPVLNTDWCFLLQELDHERKQAQIYHETRINILNLLITSLECSPPNLSLYLLGYELKKPVGTTNLQDPGTWLKGQVEAGSGEVSSFCLLVSTMLQSSSKNSSASMILGNWLIKQNAQSITQFVRSYLKRVSHINLGEQSELFLFIYL